MSADIAFSFPGPGGAQISILDYEGTLIELSFSFVIEARLGG
jgi:hypothetical protein